MKFGIGDSVRVIEYGHTIILFREDSWEKRDLAPEVVGQVGIISEVSSSNNFHIYAITGIKGKHAWYNENQLELINKNPNRIEDL